MRLVALVLWVTACGAEAPSLGRWSMRHALPAPRFEGYAAALGNRVYYLGGIGGFGTDPRDATVSAEVDVYDVQHDSWSVAVPLPDGGPRHHLIVAATGGAIYVLGGFIGILNGMPGEPFVAVGQSWRFDGAQWTRLADPPVARGAATAQAIGGKIYVVGGGPDDTQVVTDLSIYDPARDSWSAGAPLPTPRQHLASCAVDGKMIVVGGWSGPNKTSSAAAERYDPARDAWETLPPLPTARGGLGANAIGEVCYAIGGEQWDGGEDAFPLDEGFDARSGRWRTLAPMAQRRHGIGVAQVGGALYVVGGGPTRGNSYTDAVERFQP
jgi:N-acetylneuraminic acid mutarotase